MPDAAGADGQIETQFAQHFADRAPRRGGTAARRSAHRDFETLAGVGRRGRPRDGPHSAGSKSWASADRVSGSGGWVAVEGGPGGGKGRRNQASATNQAGRAGDRFRADRACGGFASAGGGHPKSIDRVINCPCSLWPGRWRRRRVDGGMSPAVAIAFVLRRAAAACLSAPPAPMIWVTARLVRRAASG